MIAQDKITRVNIGKYVESKGLKAIQIDGIPEGFSFIEPDIKIGDKVHTGKLVAFVPLTHEVIESFNMNELLENYNKVNVK